MNKEVLITYLFLIGQIKVKLLKDKKKNKRLNQTSFCFLLQNMRIFCAKKDNLC